MGLYKAITVVVTRWAALNTLIESLHKFNINICGGKIIIKSTYVHRLRP